MMHSLKTKILSAALIIVLSFVSFSALSQPDSQVSAAQVKRSLCGGSNFKLNPNDCQKGKLNANGDCVMGGIPVDPSNCGAERSLNSIITNVVNILSVIVGIVAVVMIIIGGFKYITSGGDSGNITSAKHTIIYAIVGLIIVALAQVIVRFVLSKAT